MQDGVFGRRAIGPRSQVGIARYSYDVLVSGGGAHSGYRIEAQHKAWLRGAR